MNQLTFASSLLSALQRLEEKELPGRLLLLEELNQEQQKELNLNPPSSSQLRTGVARDWPDARAVWSVCNSLVSSHDSLVPGTGTGRTQVVVQVGGFILSSICPHVKCL